VTFNLAPTIELSDDRRSGRSDQSSTARPNSFGIKILTPKPKGLKILRTMFADPAPSKTFRGGGGGGYRNQAVNFPKTKFAQLNLFSPTSPRFSQDETADVRYRSFASNRIKQPSSRQARTATG
jgi:hypothetical protein